MKKPPALTDEERAIWRKVAAVGGHMRAKSLSKARRKAIAKAAAEARWARTR